MTPVLVRLAKANPLFEQRRAEAARVRANAKRPIPPTKRRGGCAKWPN
ncbi:MAG: hypothetical protein R3C16_08880 [Hyphomonadaceae bacterium]